MSFYTRSDIIRDNRYMGHPNPGEQIDYEWSSYVGKPGASIQGSPDRGEECGNHAGLPGHFSTATVFIL
jgi:hypothetical protein